MNISVAVVGWDYEMAKTNGVVYPSADSDIELEKSSYSPVNIEDKNCTSVTYILDLPSSITSSSLQGGNITMFLYLTTVNLNPTDKLFKTLNQTCNG